jgi:repressor of nif and glnA expression
MTEETLEKRIINVEKGEQISKRIILIADNNYYSCLRVEGKVVGNVSILRKETFGDLCSTNTNVIICSGGYLDGDIIGIDNVDVSGECSGDIKASKVTVRPGAVVRGNINCVVFYGDEAVAQEGVYCFRKLKIPLT